jgi:hypothetical protein
MKRVALLTCLGVAYVSDAAAQAGGYIGGALGTFDYEESDEIVFPLSDSTSAYQLFGGYTFNEHLALELDIGRTSDIEGSFTETVPGIGDITFDVEATFDIYTFQVLGFLPFERLSLFGGVGYSSASISGPVSARGFGDVGVVDGHERGATASGGIQYDFGLDLESFSIRGEYQWFDFGSDIDASGLNIGVVFRF